MNKRYIYFPLAAGILIPSLVIFILEVFIAKMSPFKSVLDILHRQFADGQNLFMVMVFSFIPFGALLLLTLVLKAKVDSSRLACIFWGGFIPVLGLTLVGHISVWYPLYAGNDTSSTAVLAFVFFPIYCLFLLVIGSLIGWGISYFPFKRKNRIWIYPLLIVGVFVVFTISRRLSVFDSDIKFNRRLTYGTVFDIDGNTYNTVKIGTQEWMAENLKTTKYKDGTDIPNVSKSTVWDSLTTPLYCWYNNDISNKSICGAMYNWYSVNTGKLCPDGWHIPTAEEWATLIEYLGGEAIAGGKLSETGKVHWAAPNKDATNESGFTAIPGGVYYSGSFVGQWRYSYWWSCTEISETGVFVWGLTVGRGYILQDSNDNKSHGNYIRCLKD
jgi:uncharacterized protein (TIGR02145 family)